MVLSKVIVTALKLFVNHHYYLTTSKVDRTLEREVINLLVQAQLETRTGSMRKRSWMDERSIFNWPEAVDDKWVEL